ncbi:hypothetical protein KJ885_04385 [Patescibacteria group bacterium]|nr:hypothetical protein [Patescibacteria group bacterium]
MPEKFPTFNVEQEKFKQLEKLREDAHTQIEREVAERIKNNPRPTEEELLVGAFHEMIEPHVRDATFGMYKKGYSTESSGFGGENSEYQQIDGYFEIDAQTKEKLEAIGAKILKGEDIELPGFGDDYTFIRFSPQEADLNKIKEKWDKIVSLLPEKNKPVLPSTSGGSEDFRKTFAPERIDIERQAIEIQLASGNFSPEAEEDMQKRLEKIKLIESVLTNKPLPLETVQKILDEEKINEWPDEEAIVEHIKNKPEEAILEVEKYREDIEKAGDDPDAIIAEYKKFKDFDKLEVIPLNKLPYWEKIISYLGEDRAYDLSNLNVVLIEDEKYWKAFFGTNPSKSSFDINTIILKKDIFSDKDISDEQLSWLVHEIGHIKVYDMLEDNLKNYENIFRESGEYINTSMESVAFQAQFDFLKSVGKSKEECVDFIKEYLNESYGEDTELTEKDKKAKERDLGYLVNYVNNIF